MADYWKPIEGWPKYQVGRCGDVRGQSGKLLKKRPDGKGYLRVALCNKGERVDKRVHILVAQAFIPNPLNLPEVNHINLNKAQNNSLNLEWCTHQENMDHYYANGDVVVLQGEDHGMAKLKEEDVVQIRLMLEEGYSSRTISKTYPVTEQMIYRIKYRKAWKHI